MNRKVLYEKQFGFQPKRSKTVVLIQIETIDQTKLLQNFSGSAVTGVAIDSFLFLFDKQNSLH